MRFMVPDYNDDLDKRQIAREMQFILAEQDAEIEKIRQSLKTGNKPMIGEA